MIHTGIDKFLTSNALNQFVTDTLIKPFPHSDHDCVYLTLNFEQVNRGPGYWHFNNDLLNDAAFESQINDFWSTWKTKYDAFDDLCYGGTGRNINLKSSQSVMQNY